MAVAQGCSTYLEVGGHDLKVRVDAQQVMLLQLQLDMLRDEVNGHQALTWKYRGLGFQS